LIKIWFGPGVGTSKSLNTSFWPKASTTAACIRTGAVASVMVDIELILILKAVEPGEMNVPMPFGLR
jgi:hypothetical protein